MPISEALAGGDKVQLVGFGTFEVKERGERKGINPRTKKEITIAASKLPSFKAGKALKDAVSQIRICKRERALRKHGEISCVYAFFLRSFMMRLDKYLKVTRLIKRRTVANEACDAGRILVNGKVARASYEVKENDLISIQMGTRPIKVRVLKVSEYATKEDASTHYTVVED